jgi:hypothetical protein
LAAILTVFVDYNADGGENVVSDIVLIVLDIVLIATNIVDNDIVEDSAVFGVVDGVGHGR